MQIRTARPEDEAALTTIDLETWSPAVSPAPRPGSDGMFTHGTDRRNVLVAEQDGEIVGFVMLRQALALPSHAHVLEINGLAVAPRHQGRGIGTALLDAATTEARDRGATKLTLRVLGPNTSARRLYEASGFIVEGTLRGEFLIDDRLVDDVLMARFLT